MRFGRRLDQLWKTGFVVRRSSHLTPLLPYRPFLAAAADKTAFSSKASSREYPADAAVRGCSLACRYRPDEAVA